MPEVWKIHYSTGTANSSGPAVEYFEDQERLEARLLELTLQELARNQHGRVGTPFARRAARQWLRWFSTDEDYSEDSKIFVLKVIQVARFDGEQWIPYTWTLNHPSITLERS